ncbi:Anaerobic selenocysteine-containing dehydrogenase [Natronincola peptidivorans]|uniref:Anaerobic selenocysteine-containing dehydrogenase n=1 Tax=Natronincola peptidivorans TaxID=426128 RepID=A0A1I0FLN2_9FIRM|nr:molybdopterin-dependent oxidoreductase [Natronincola peptidivorans]SET59018.1 Anaerobic selenocysteine-containing dehydrogenase [Natronincola peptidivorans]
MIQKSIDDSRYNSTKAKTVASICSICNSGCGILLHIENNKLIKASGDKDNPVTRGYICVKGKALPEIVNSPHRLKEPMIKNKDNSWQKISWAEAIDIIAKKLKELKKDYGPEALAVHVGQAGVRREFTPYLERFCFTYGTPNFSTCGSHCHKSKDMAGRVTYGALTVPDYINSKSVVLWGSNHQKSCPTLANNVNTAMKKGACLIVIDPIKTELAKKADLFLQIRPGTDGALALAMIHVIINENLYDKNFVEKWTFGFEELAQHVKEFTPEWASKITRVPSEKIIRAARIFATNGPGNITPGIAVELQTNGFQAIRGMTVLQAITGNLDIAGGALMSPPATLSPLRIEEDLDALPTAIGESRFPLFYDIYKNAQANVFSDGILDSEPNVINAMIIMGSNPISTWPNAEKLKRAFKKLDFLVVMDHFMTETSEMADMVLPAATFLERNEFWDRATTYGLPILCLIPKVLEEEGCISEWEFIMKLAKEMGYKDMFPWESQEEAMEFRLQPLGITLKQLNGTEGYQYRDVVMQKYENAGFQTPSNKVELYSQILERFGYNPLPIFEEPDESPVSRKDLASEYPFVLTTGAREIEFYHSRYRNVASLRNRLYEPLALLNPIDGEELGINNKQRIRIETPRGAIEIKACFTQDIMPGVISIPHGWDNANANLLTDNAVLDPVCGFPADRALLARISKAE